MKNSFYPAFEMPELDPWPEPVDGQTLLDLVAKTLRQVVVLPEMAAEALTLFTPHTYAFQLREVSTYLGIESPEKRCGKTTLLGVLAKLVSRPVVAANISPPAFFRVIQETQPTLLIDEADMFLRRRGELRGIINAGYTKETAYVMRVAPESKNAESRNQGDGSIGAAEGQNSGSRLVRFSCWCPKVMASIGRLPETMSDRCIPIRMQRKTSHERCVRLRDVDPNLITLIKRQCLRFVGDHSQEIANARPVMPSSLNDREADCWEPLVAIGDVVGGRWPQLAREAALKLTETARESNPMGALLLDIWLIFLSAGVDRIFSRTLAGSLNGLGERPWSELKKGKPIDPLWLSRIFHPYDVRPRTIWIGNEHAKGYLEKDFEVLFSRYIPRAEIDALLAESAESKSRTHEQTPGGGQQKPEEGGQKKDEEGGTESGEAAAA